MSRITARLTDAERRLQIQQALAAAATWRAMREARAANAPATREPAEPCPVAGPPLAAWEILEQQHSRSAALIHHLGEF